MLGDAISVMGPLARKVAWLRSVSDKIQIDRGLRFSLTRAITL